MRTRSRFVVFVAAAALPLAAAASCPYVDDHAISARMSDESDRSGGVTTELRAALSTACAAWDKELNWLYQELLGTLPREADRDALRAAPRAWLAFDRAERLWDETGAMHGLEGTSGPLNIGGSQLQRLQQRVCDLKLAQEVGELRSPEELGASRP